MYRLFSASAGEPKSLYHFPRMTYLREQMAINVGRLTELRRKFPRPIKNTHPLSRLLSSLTTPFEGNLDLYRSGVEREMGRVTGLLGMSSSQHHGSGYVADDLFYKDAVEIVIAHAEEFDLGAFWQGWADAMPIRVLSHPIASLDLLELDGRVGASEPYQLATVAVNVPMLACQYQMWRASKRLTPNEPSTVNHFLNAVPLTNAVRSHLDVAFINLVLVRNRVFAEMGLSGKPDLNFAQLSLTGIGQDITDDYCTRISKQALTAGQLAANLPVLYAGSAWDVWQLPKGLRTNQVVWALVAARIDAAGFLLKHLADTGNGRLIPELTLIQRDLVQLSNERWFTNGLAATVQDVLVRKLNDEIINRLP